jgi:molybdopterin-containing oxidoreductase family membrane subunit
VHSVVSWDFAVSIVPGWHSTIFAPYFVAGAMFSGVAMVIVILAALRHAHHLEAYVTPGHFDGLARILLVTSLIVTYATVTEYVMASFGGRPAERELFLFRATGTFAPLFWLMVLFNSVLPLACFWSRVRSSIAALVVLSILVNVGMYLERLVIIVASLARAHDPFLWSTYQPKAVELLILAGSFGWFSFWFLLFGKLFPAVALAELKEHAAVSDTGEAHGS